MISEPLERLADAPSFSELHKHKSNGFADSLIGMKADLTREIPGVANRQPLRATRRGVPSIPGQPAFVGEGPSARQR